MNLRNSMAVFVPAVMLTLLASVIELTARVPDALAYFAIALLAASLTLLITGKAARQSRTVAGSATNAGKETGSVKWFSASKGFGFITRDNGEDIFVHFRSITGNGHRVLREGQRVEFEVTEGSKGLQAEDVVALK